jgi:hypothetical protein
MKYKMILRIIDKYEGEKYRGKSENNRVSLLDGRYGS